MLCQDHSNNNLLCKKWNGHFLYLALPKLFFMKKMISLFLAVITSSFMLNLAAQSLNADDIKSQFAVDWERAKEYTIEYLNTMPADKYSAKAVDSIRSFAEQMLHLASANVFLMATATGEKPLSWASFTLESRKTAQSKDSVMYFVTSSYDFCKNAVKNFDPAKWGESRTLFGFNMTAFALMQKTFEHQTHHRGQTTIYIRLQDIRPPQEKLF